MRLLIPTSLMLALVVAQPLAARGDDKALGGGPRLSLKACGEKYRAAKSAGAPGAVKWRDFRQTECGFAATRETSHPAALRSEAVRAEAVSRLTFPTRVADEFQAEKPWKARMRTCLKSYRENKQARALYGIRWIEKGGGYYGLCAQRLKSSA